MVRSIARECFVRPAAGLFFTRLTTICGCRGIWKTWRTRWSMRISLAPCMSMSTSTAEFAAIFLTSSDPNSRAVVHLATPPLRFVGKQRLWTGIRRSPVGRVFPSARGLEHYPERAANRSVHVDEICARTLVQNQVLAMADLAAFPCAGSTRLDRTAARNRACAMDQNHQ